MQRVMDTAQIRQHNFQTLFRRFREQNAHLPDRGMLKLFAEKLELSDRYLSHLKCGRKNIGANIARHIEKRLKLPHGWMDNDHENSVQQQQPTDELERNFMETALAIYRSSPTEARSMMLDFLKHRLGNKNRG